MPSSRQQCHPVKRSWRGLVHDAFRHNLSRPETRDSRVETLIALLVHFFFKIPLPPHPFFSRQSLRQMILISFLPIPESYIMAFLSSSFTHSF